MKRKNYLDKFIDLGNSTVGNRDGAIWKKVALGSRRNRGDIWRNFSPIPNVKAFRLEVDGGDDIMLKFGIFKNFNPSAMFLNYRNRDINRYVEHQLRRLHSSDEVRYGRLALYLLRKSRAFRVMALHHVYPDWYKKGPVWGVSRLLWKVGELAENPLQRIVFARVYIAKEGGKWRPLGVPSPVGRVYLHQVAQFLSYRIAPRLHPEQHGYRFGFSIMTAWKSILENAIKEDNIYEYDLKGFFDNISINFVVVTLKKFLGMPDEMMEARKKDDALSLYEMIDGQWHFTGGNTFGTSPKKAEESGRYKPAFLDLIRFLGKSYPILPKVRKLDEFPAEMKGLNHAMTDLMFMGFMPKLEDTGIYGRFANLPIRAENTGFPQGAPMSPLLSIVGLEQSLFKLWPKFVQYSDDGIFYGGKELKCLVEDRSRLQGIPEQEEVPEGKLAENYAMIAAGCRFNYEKSGGVKKDGKWLKPLKFLGMVYDGNTDKFGSRTRKGKALWYDKEHMLQLLEERDLSIRLDKKKYAESRNSFYHYCNSRYAGFVQARLFNGSGNQDKLGGTPTLKFINLSFAEGLTGKGASLDNFNCSSLACRSLLEIGRNVASVHPKSASRFSKRMVNEMTDSDPSEGNGGEDTPPTSRARISRANFVNRSRWLSAYAGPYFEYQIFILPIIEANLSRPVSDDGSHFDRSTQIEGYRKRYVKHKVDQCEAVLKKGDRLILMAKGLPDPQESPNTKAKEQK